MRYKQPWGAKAHAPTILLLPSFERGLFDMDGVAYFHDVMSQLAMQALAVGCQSPLRMGVLPPCSFVPFTLFPTQTRFAVLLDTPLLIVVLWIISAALPVHLALQATLFPGVGCQFLAKRD
jgi:hypothetical protein